MPGKRKTVGWHTEIVLSKVAAHPDLLSVPTFVLFVQKDLVSWRVSKGNWATSHTHATTHLAT